METDGSPWKENRYTKGKTVGEKQEENVKTGTARLSSIDGVMAGGLNLICHLRLDEWRWVYFHITSYYLLFLSLHYYYYHYYYYSPYAFSLLFST